MSLLHIIDNQTRVGLLKRIIKEKKYVKIIETHNGLSGLIANELKVKLKDGSEIEFDGFWESSLTDSASKGYPDIEIISLDSRLDTINQILDVTNKPMIVDGDTGGDCNQFEYMVKRLERAGVSMVIIEDKVFPKRNSLEAGTRQELENIEIFCEKIRRGLNVRNNPDFMIVARLESLIAGHGIREALERAEACLKAGADGIMIHSKASDPAEILEFTKKFYLFPQNIIKNKVLVCVPTTYNTITDTELANAGFNVIIHANHLLRASYKAMENVCKKILTYDRSFEVDSDCISVKEIFKKVGFLDVKEKDKEIADKLKSKIKVIIPAAGADQLAKELNSPISLMDINGKSVLQRQMETLSKCGLDNITVIKGFQKDMFQLENITYVDNPHYENTHILSSLFCAGNALNESYIYLNSDILFNEHIINALISFENAKNKDIILVVDNSYEHHKHDIHKKLDLVRTNRTSGKESLRNVIDTLDEEVEYIGKKISNEIAHYEFIGIAYFSKRGARILKDAYDSLKDHGDTFQEAKSIQMASFTDIIQEIVDRGYPVNVLKTYQGWMEIHNIEDIEIAKRFY